MLGEEVSAGSAEDPFFLVVLLGFLLQRAARAPPEYLLCTHMLQSLVLPPLSLGCSMTHVGPLAIAEAAPVS